MLKRHLGKFRAPVELNLVAVGLSAFLLSFLEIATDTLFAESPVRALSWKARVAVFGGHAAIQVACLVVPVVTGLLTAKARRVDNLARFSATVIQGAIWGGFALCPFFFLGLALSRGQWISAQPGAWAIPYGLGILGGLFFFGYGWLAAKFSGRPCGAWGWIFTVTSAGATVGLLTGNAAFLRGQYDAFHLALYLMAAFFSWNFTSRLVLALAPLVRWSWVLRGLSILIFGLVVSGIGLVLFADRSLRSEMLMKSRIASLFFVKLTITSGQTNARVVLERLMHRKKISDPLPDWPRGRIKIGDDWNVILLIVDAMRADTVPPARKPKQPHTGPDDTPFLNEWIKQTYRFHYAYAQADLTKKSMPSLMHSITSADFDKEYGAPFPHFVRRLGRTPIALVCSLFVERWRKFDRLLDGFEHVDIYDKNAQQRQNRKFIDLLKGVRDGPFFAWYHLYALHSPYFGGRRCLTAKDGSYPERYQRALRWTDKELETLFEELQKIGVMDKTVVILTADHGEGLGDHGLKTHGSYVFEEEVRVPLFIRIPGHAGGDIHSTVGIIDLLPTVVDLLGGSEIPYHRGKSLVPLMADKHRQWSRDYYLENSIKNYEGIVRGRDKLIYRSDVDLLFRYDLKKDPREKTNRFKADGELDQYLLSRLVLTAPILFKHELRDTQTRMLLEVLLDNASSDWTADEIMLPVRLAAVSGQNDLIEKVEDLYERMESADLRGQIAGTMFRLHKQRWSDLIVEYLDRVSGSREELDFVARLAFMRLPRFQEKVIARRIEWWVRRGGSGALEQFLLLIRNWPRLSGKHFYSVLLRVVEKLDSERDPLLVSYALDGLAKLTGKNTERRRRLAELAGKLQRERNSSVQMAACALIGALREKAGLKTLIAIVEDEHRPGTVREAAMRAAVQIDKTAAAPAIARAGRNERLTRAAIEAMLRIRSPERTAFLEWAGKRHKSPSIRAMARKALRAGR